MPNATNNTYRSTLLNSDKNSEVIRAIQTASNSANPRELLTMSEDNYLGTLFATHCYFKVTDMRITQGRKNQVRLNLYPTPLTVVI